jgi:hypothetical protein
VFESKAPDEVTDSGITPNSGTSVAANFDLADGTCKFHSSSYYCQSVRTTTTTTLAAFCSSLYTSSMCPSNHLRDGQHQIVCNGNPCEDGPDDATCCMPKAKCSSLPFKATMCASGTLLANQETLECTESTCVEALDEDNCCEAPTCSIYTCTGNNSQKISGTDATEQGDDPETTCCEAISVAGSIGPSHAWDFRGCTTGTAVADAYGTEMATPQNGPTCSSEGVTFDGNSQYMDIDDFSWGGSVSVETYAKWTTGSSAHTRAFYFGSDSESDCIKVYNSDGVAVFRVKDDAGANVEATSSGNTLVDDQFHHLVMVIDGTTVKGYVDGAEVATETIGAEMPVGARTSNFIGCGRYGTVINGCMTGTVGYTRMFAKALSDSEVSELYNARGEAR